MSRRNIDERIVEMQFQNRQFEDGVQTSIKSLDNLKKSLDFDGAEKSLQNLEKSTRHFSMDGLTGAIEAVSGKFSAMEIVAITTLQRITNKALDTGEQLIRSLSIDQITSGFNKYTDKTKSVNTIMNATGESIDYVNERLDKLNWFTDETSYNFTDMVSNIGKFTSAGVSLDDATTAMMGIATEAALSGQGINEASRAMYNFAQAIGAGQVKLMDWRSIENANMGTQEFKQTIIDTAVAMGKLKKDTKGTVKTVKGTNVTFKNFNETLSENWFTSEVLIESLRKYGAYAEEVYKVATRDGITAAEAMEKMGDAGMELGAKAFKAAQVARTFTDAIEATKDAVSSGWMRSFELIFGDVNESAELWTDVTNALWEVFAAGAESRNEVLKAWHDAAEGGRADLLEGVYDAFEALWNIITSVREALEEIFPVDWDEKLKSFSTSIKDFGKNLKKTFGIEEEVVGQETVDIVESLPNKVEEFDKALQRGARGEGVKQMQERLEKLGYSVGLAGIDGIFGPDTEKALKAYEEAAGRAIDGIYDKADHMDIMGAIYGTHDHVVGQETIDVIEEKLSPALEKLKTVAEGFFSAIHLGAEALQFFGNVVGYVFQIVSPVTSAIGDLGVELSACFTNWVKGVDESGTFEKWLNDIKTFLEPAKKWFEDLGASIRDFFGTDEGITTFEQFWERIEQSLEKHPKIKAAWEQAKKIFEDIKSFFGTLKKAVMDFVIVKDENGDPLGFFESLKTRLEAFQPVLDWISNAISSIFGGDGESSVEDINEKIEQADSVFTKIGDFFRKAIDTLSGINWGALAVTAAGIFSAIKVIGLLRAPLKFLKGISEIPESISEMFGGLKKAAKRFGKDKVGDTILKISASIALVAASIFAIAQLDVGKAWNAVGVIAALSAVMVGMSILVSKFGAVSIKNSLGLVAISGSILMLAMALKTLSGLSLESVGVGILGVIGLLAAVAGFEKLMGGTKFATGVLELGYGLDALAKALVKLSSLSLSQIGTGLLGIAGLLASLAIFARVTNGSAIKGGIGLIGIALGLLILVQPLKMIAKLDINSILRGLGGIFGILLLVGLYQKLLGKSGSLTSGLNMVVIAAGLLLLVKPLQTIASLDAGSILRGLGGILGILLLVGTYQKLLGKTGSLSSGFSMAIIAAGLLLLVKPLQTVGQLDAGSILRGLGGILGLLLLVGTYQKVIGNSGSLSSGFSMAVIAADLLLLVEPLKTVGQMDTDSIIRGLGGIFGALLMVGLYQKLLGNAGSWSSGLGMAGLAAGIWVIIQAFTPLLGQDFESILTAVIGFGAILGEVAIFAKLLNGIQININSLLMLPLLGATIAAFALAVNGVKDVPWETMVGFGAGLILVSGAISILALAGKAVDLKSILTISAALVAISAAIGAAIAILGTVVAGTLENFANAMFVVGSNLNSFSEMTDGLDQGVFDNAKSCLQSISEAAAQALLINADDFKDFATAVFRIGVALKSYSLLISGLSAENSEIAKTMMSDLVVITTSAAAVTLPSTSLTRAITRIGSAIKLYNSSLADITPSTGTANVQSIKDTFAALAEDMPEDADVARVAGFAEGGGNDLTDFALGITALGTALSKYATDIGGLDTKKLATANEALGYLAGLNEKMPNEEGFSFATVLTGKKESLDAFALDIVSLGEALAQYATSIGSIDEGGKLKTAEGVLDAIAGLNDKLPSSGGLWQFISGTQDLGNFAANMSVLGDGVARYANAVANSDFTNVEASMGPITVLGDIQSKIGSSGGLANLFSGTQSIGVLSKELPGLGTNLAAFANAIKDATFDNSENAMKPISALAGIQGDLEKAGGMASWFTGDKSFGTLGEDLAKLGTKLSEFNTSITNVDFERIRSAIGIVRSLTTMESAVSGIQNFGRMSQLMSTVTTFFENMSYFTPNEEDVANANALIDGSLGSIVSTILAYESKFADAGDTLVSAFIDNVSKGEDEATTTVINMMNAAVEVAANRAGDFETVGTNCALGLAAGISAGTRFVVNAAESVMKRAIAAAKAIADQNSPSKVFAEIGMNNDLGLALGMREYGYVVQAASEDVAQDAIDATGSMISRLSSLVTEDMDTTPTIRPVMDLSDVSRGVSTMNGLFGYSQRYTPSMSYSMAQSAASSGYSGRPVPIRADSSSDLVTGMRAEIRELRSAIENMQIVTETGALVGAIGSKMDAYLGQQKEFAKRR